MVDTGESDDCGGNGEIEKIRSCRWFPGRCKVLKCRVFYQDAVSERTAEHVQMNEFPEGTLSLPHIGSGT